ncbi:uncharacterized protein METZ01_LOCUS135169 [marine metagenome]|uniref:Uncharacterized protein n=1 Tax=marine metagenome TaxID=408172 RepID=A0A381YZ78_9ZZZZ
MYLRLLNAFLDYIATTHRGGGNGIRTHERTFIP